jgi:hypothetical protein
VPGMLTIPACTSLQAQARTQCVTTMLIIVFCFPGMSHRCTRSRAPAQGRMQLHPVSVVNMTSQCRHACARRKAALVRSSGQIECIELRMFWISLFDGAAVAALCRDKAALGSVYDSIVAGLRVPRPGVQPSSAATAAQPHQLNGWPRKRQHCASDQQAADTSFPAARGGAADHEQPDSPTRDAAGLLLAPAVSWAQ